MIKLGIRDATVKNPDNNPSTTATSSGAAVTSATIAVEGMDSTAEAIARAAVHAADGVQPLGDIHASPEFRAHLAQVNTRRAIERALGRA
jgi:carbon-monoxide dehydrogenase medium subunit